MAGVAGDLRRHATVFAGVSGWCVWLVSSTLCCLRGGVLELMLAAFDAVNLFGDKNTKQ